MPSVATTEPVDLCLMIIEDRAYARALDLVKRTEKQSDLPDDPMVDMVLEIQFDVAREALEAKRAKRG